MFIIFYRYPYHWVFFSVLKVISSPFILVHIGNISKVSLYFYVKALEGWEVMYTLYSTYNKLFDSLCCSQLESSYLYY